MALAPDLLKQDLMVLVWEPITDLPEDWRSLTDGELGPLLQFWHDQRADLEKSGALKVFTQRLSREWSIETGQIEGVYNLDRGITQTLIERGIDADLIPTEPGQKPPEIIAAIIQDHADVLEGLFQFVKGDRPLSKSYIHELHAALLKHQDTTTVVDQFGNFFEARLLKGKYKERPNNPKKPDGGIHQYCPPEQVDSEMDRLLALHSEHELKDVPVEIEAAWLHHRFTQIHPYQDGNGRVARALASLLFLKAGWFPVVITRDDRSRYIDALEVADEGDLHSLVTLLAEVQKRTLFENVQAAAESGEVHTVADAIAAAKRALLSLGKHGEPAPWVKTKQTVEHLMELAGERFEEVAASLESEIKKNKPDFRAQTSPARFSFPYLLDQLPYKPNPDDYTQVRELSILTEKRDGLYEQAVFGVHAHAIGSKFRALIGIVGFFRDFTRFPGSGLQIASRIPFQTNYAETIESAEQRFRPWLEESIVNALTLWRKSL